MATPKDWTVIGTCGGFNFAGQPLHISRFLADTKRAVKSCPLMQVLFCGYLAWKYIPMFGPCMSVPVLGHHSSAEDRSLCPRVAALRGGAGHAGHRTLGHRQQPQGLKGIIHRLHESA